MKKLRYTWKTQEKFSHVGLHHVNGENRLPQVRGIGTISTKTPAVVSSHHALVPTTLISLFHDPHVLRITVSLLFAYIPSFLFFSWLRWLWRMWTLVLKFAPNVWRLFIKFLGQFFAISLRHDCNEVGILD